MQSIRILLSLFSANVALSLSSEKPVCDPVKYKNTSLGDSDRKLITSYHNRIREKIAKGEAKNYVGNLPAAKNMYKLKYDCKMEQLMQKALETNDYSQIISGYGLNEASSYIIYEAPLDAVKQNLIQFALDSWYDPVQFYGLRNTENACDDGRLYTFANMINAKTLRLGCACGLKFYGFPTFSCIYNLVGGFPNNTLYEKGEPCKDDADCTTYPNSTCIKEKGLCNYSGAVPKPGEGENTMCKRNKEMNDLSRKEVLEAHNKKKSLLARGQVQNGPNKSVKLPTSSFMPVMIYDCALEAQAIAYSKNCTMKKSNETSREGYGENVFIYPGPNVDPVIALKAAVESWWSQIYSRSINGNVRFDESIQKHETDQTSFTQMAWAKSVKLGCAAQTCYMSTFVVCRYSPAHISNGNVLWQAHDWHLQRIGNGMNKMLAYKGNIRDEQIYLPGDVCSFCIPACNVTEGLCRIY